MHLPLQLVGALPLLTSLTLATPIANTDYNNLEQRAPELDTSYQYYGRMEERRHEYTACQKGPNYNKTECDQQKTRSGDEPVRRGFNEEREARGGGAGAGAGAGRGGGDGEESHGHDEHTHDALVDTLAPTDAPKPTARALNEVREARGGGHGSGHGDGHGDGHGNGHEHDEPHNANANGPLPTTNAPKPTRAARAINEAREARDGGGGDNSDGNLQARAHGTGKAVHLSSTTTTTTASSQHAGPSA
ncbi:hypothetical protein MMC06_006876, partial [Schaereria dolodes]|nr:hypothetical protein [Schaereria dolodes]